MPEEEVVICATPKIMLIEVGNWFVGEVCPHGKSH